MKTSGSAGKVAESGTWKQMRASPVEAGPHYQWSRLVPWRHVTRTCWINSFCPTLPSEMELFEFLEEEWLHSKDKSKFAKWEKRWKGIWDISHDVKEHGEDSCTWVYVCVCVCVLGLKVVVKLDRLGPNYKELSPFAPIFCNHAPLC